MHKTTRKYCIENSSFQFAVPVYRANAIINVLKKSLNHESINNEASEN